MHHLRLGSYNLKQPIHLHTLNSSEDAGLASTVVRAVVLGSGEEGLNPGVDFSHVSSCLYCH